MILSTVCPACACHCDQVQMPGHPADWIFVYCCSFCDRYHDGFLPLTKPELDRIFARRLKYESENYMDSEPEV